MSWTVKLIALGVVVLSLMAAFGSFVYGQREIGREQAKAAQAEKERKQAARDAELDRKAKEAADEIAKRQKARAIDSERKLATMQAVARSLSDGLAAKDQEYRSWRDVRIPRALNGMRDDGELPSPEDRQLPVRVPAGAVSKPGH